MRARGTQSIYNAELQAIEMSLIIYPANIDIIIWVDNQAAVKICHKYKELPDSQKQKQTNNDIVYRINKLIEHRKAMGGNTEINHVFSHLRNLTNGTKLSQKEKTKLEKRLKILEEKWGKEKTNLLIEGNDEADILAKAVTELPEYNIPDIPPEQNKFTLVQNKQKNKYNIPSSALNNNTRGTLLEISQNKRIKE